MIFRLGIVVVGAHIEYERPFTFFSAEEFEVRGVAELAQDRRLLLGHFSFLHNDERFLSACFLARPVAMVVDNSFAAVPCAIEGHILDKFDPDEVSDRRIERVVPKLLDSLDPKSLLGESAQPLRLYRHDSEAADQWSYIEMGAHAASARESMVLDAGHELSAKLQPGLITPTRSVDFEIRRPLFLYDTAQVRTRAYGGPEGLSFVHVFQSQIGGTHDHATIIERFGA